MRAVVTVLASLILISAPLVAQRAITRSIFVSALDTGGAPVVNLTTEDFQVIETA